MPNWLIHTFATLLSLSTHVARTHAAYYFQEHPELLPLIQRKFRSAGDVDTAQRLVFDSRGLQRARELAAQHASLAVRAVRLLRPVLAAPAPVKMDCQLCMAVRPQLCLGNRQALWLVACCSMLCLQGWLGTLQCCCPRSEWVQQ